jgi:hypothetical protein
MNGDNLNNVRHETTDFPGIKEGNILKTKLMSLQHTVRTGTSENCIEE